MMSEVVQRVYCTNCNRELTEVEDLTVCDCGSRDFMYGNTLVLNDGKLMCECGSEMMEMVAHMNMSPKFIKTYRCCCCGATISTEIYYESQYI